MEEFSIKKLEKIISDGDFKSLIGKIENDFFDCKGQIYDLKNESSKRELAKDVSSFANLNGGYILIGPKTKNSETHFGDEVIEISLFDQNLVNPNQYLNVIKDWIYPDEIQGIKVYWKASKIDNNKGIIVIEIPAQKESLKPFLISKIVEEEKKISETIFGYAERKRDRSDPKKIKDIYEAMSEELLMDSTEKNITFLNSVLENLEVDIASEKTKNHNQYKYTDDIDFQNFYKILDILQEYKDTLANDGQWFFNYRAGYEKLKLSYTIYNILIDSKNTQDSIANRLKTIAYTIERVKCGEYNYLYSKRFKTALDKIESIAMNYRDSEISEKYKNEFLLRDII